MKLPWKSAQQFTGSPTLSSEKPTKQTDVWKGLSLLGLTFNHLLLWPCSNLSFALNFTYQSVGWVSFASVFFAIAGVQWGRRAENQTPQQLLNWNFKRAIKLFAWVGCATAIFVLANKASLLEPAPWQRHLIWNAPSTVLMAISGFQLPWLLDVIWLHAWLGVYATILWSLPKIRSSSLCIALVSACVWLLSQAGYFNVQSQLFSAPSWHAWTGWQLLFVGCALSQRKDVQAVIGYFRKSSLRLIIIIIAAALLISKHTLSKAEVDPFLQTQKFGPLFATNTVCFCLLLGEHKFPRMPKIVATIGKRSLLFYSMQCVVIYTLGSHTTFAQNQKTISLWIVVLVSLLLPTLCWLIAQRRSR
jgi:hypothetical protein